MKNASFSKKICVYQKKAVILHAFLEKAARCDIVWIIASCEVIIV